MGGVVGKTGEKKNMNRTKIEYLDFTWNPIVGCSGINCAVSLNCWACKMAKRQKHRCEECYSFVPHVHFERFDQPFKRKKPARIGVAFMGEFYDEWITESVRAELKMQMEKAFWHTYVIFTKQPQNIDLDEPIPKNVWLAVSVNRKSDTWRIDMLRETEAKVKAVSFEPLYEDIPVDLKGIDWIIIGAQTRPLLEPNPKWVMNLIVEATVREIPLFLKNNLNHANPIQEIPNPKV